MGRKSTLDLPDALDTMLSQHSGRRQHEAQANAGLVKRLSHTQSFKGHSSAVNALDWSSNGEILLSGGDDCRVKLWSSKSSGAMHSFDSVRHIECGSAPCHIDYTSKNDLSCMQCKTLYKFC